VAGTTEAVDAEHIGAFVPHTNRDPVRGRAGGPMDGLTFAVKDMYDVAGQRTGGGSPTWLDTHPVAGSTAPVVQRLLDAGGTLVGRTVCDELFYSVTGANAHYGTPRNVQAPGRLPGGSSAGSAAAVAARLCDVALGSDTGGSVRVPAAFCGVFGIRTTHGRIGGPGIMSMAPSFDSVGWFSDRAGLLQLVGSVLLGTAVAPGPSAVERLLVAEDAFAVADVSVADAVRNALHRMDGMLPAPQSMRLWPDGPDPWREAFRVVQAREVWETFGAWATRHRPVLGPGIRERVAWAATVTPEQTEAQRRVLDAARGHVRGLLRPGTVLALPTAPCIAPPVDESPAGLDGFRTRAMALTCPAGLAGLPQITVPAGLVEGCPVGLSFVGWPGGDEALLALAGQVAPVLDR
jgi:amidase